MVDAKNVGKMGVIGLIGILVGFGGTSTLSQGQVGDVYVCPVTEEVGQFDRVSGSAGFYMVDGNDQRVYCNDGNDYQDWVSLTVYAESQGVDPGEFVESVPSLDSEVRVEGRQGVYTCSTNENGAVEQFSTCANPSGDEVYAGELLGEAG